MKKPKRQPTICDFCSEPIKRGDSQFMQGNRISHGSHYRPKDAEDLRREYNFKFHLPPEPLFI